MGRRCDDVFNGLAHLCAQPAENYENGGHCFNIKTAFPADQILITKIQHSHETILSS